MDPGTQLGPYEIKEPLGKGGMGEVYRAHDSDLRRDVAIKLLPQELAADAGRLARLKREARSLASLNHPGIATVHGFEKHDGTRFIVMELVEGETLGERLREGALPVEEALEYAQQIARALETAHGRGIVHRDLKPANVKVTPAGDVKVLDFGLAKPLREESGEEAHSELPTATVEATRTGTILGTAAYMSPEQARGEEIDTRTDVWSFGCVLYEMVTGRRPFRGKSSAEVISSILRDEPVPTTELRSELPEQVDGILDRCLAKNPERRFHSGKDLHNELQELREALHEARLLEAIEKGDRKRPPPATGTPRGTDAPLTTQPRPSATVTPSPSPMQRLPMPALPAALLGILLVVAMLFGLRIGVPFPAAETAAVERVYPRTALAVLPFQDLSADPEHAYFAGGLHDELLTQLSKVATLSLRGRRSVVGYGDTTKPIRQIAEELQVGALVEGSVQVVDDRLRVNVQLIDAGADEHLWAESYDRTLDDAFAIQSDVAQQVVSALGAVLGATEREALSEAATPNPEAYRLYLQGREYHTRPGHLRQNLEAAEELYERALSLDRQFALAHAALSDVHGQMHWLSFDTSPARVERQREEAEAALRLAPELPQAHVAMGLWHYWGRRDFGRALEEFSIALEGMPNDAWLRAAIGYVHRRLGNWDEVLAAFDHATELDPRDADLFLDLGGATYRFLHRYEDAVAAFDQALSLAPDLREAALDRAWTHVLWQGRLDAVWTVLRSWPRDSDLGALGTTAAYRARLLHWERKADRLLQLLATAHQHTFEGTRFFYPRSLYEAWAHELRDDRVAASKAYESALDVTEDRLRGQPGDVRVHAARGLILAGLDDREQALREAHWLQQSVVYREDALGGKTVAEDRARILAQAGEAEAALDEIERLLAGPSRLSVHILDLDPLWDPIRAHPRFQELLVRYRVQD